MNADPHAFPAPGELRGVEHAGVIDLITHDEDEQRAELVMFERRPWDGGEDQLFELQEKLNDYLSFALDGEMAEAYPELANAALTVVLRCTEEPTPEVVAFLSQVRDQIGLQGIDLQVRYAREGSGGCGHGCGCH